MTRTMLAAACAAWIGASAQAAITPDRVLLLYNSANAESLAIRNAYVAARPGVLQFDLNDATLPPGSIPRSVFNTKVRAPLLAHLNSGPTGQRLSEQVIAIATTHGLPARIDGGDEFSIFSTWASLESELSIIQQDLSLAAPAPGRVASLIINPYYRRIDQGIETFSRAGIETPRSFTLQDGAFWLLPGLTSGDIYLVCRLDAAAGGANGAGATVVQNVQSLISRSQSISIAACGSRALFDEWACVDQLDDDGGGFIPAVPRFERAAGTFSTLGFPVTSDATSAFFTGPDVPDQSRSLIFVGTYGENHSLNGCGNDPFGPGTYVRSYTNVSPGASFIAYESWGGHSIVFPGATRGDQGQALDFIAAGGTFTIATVTEPFTITIADADILVQNLYQFEMTFAEAAYSSLPGLSWQTTPVGDPLAKVVIVGGAGADFTGDGIVNAADLAVLLGSWGTTDCVVDLNGNGIVDATDLGILLGSWTP